MAPKKAQILNAEQQLAAVAGVDEDDVNEKTPQNVQKCWVGIGLDPSPEKGDLYHQAKKKLQDAINAVGGVARVIEKAWRNASDIPQLAEILPTYRIYHTESSAKVNGCKQTKNWLKAVAEEIPNMDVQTLEDSTERASVLVEKLVVKKTVGVDPEIITLEREIIEEAEEQISDLLANEQQAIEELREADSFRLQREALLLFIGTLLNLIAFKVFTTLSWAGIKSYCILNKQKFEKYSEALRDFIEEVVDPDLSAEQAAKDVFNNDFKKEFRPELGQKASWAWQLFVKVKGVLV